MLVADAYARTTPADGPTYDFRRIDALQAAAATRGIKLQLTIAGPAPGMGDGRPPGRQLPPRRRQVRRVRARPWSRTSAGRVDRYAIWNEPNWNTWLAPGKNAASLYRGALLGGLQRRPRRADPQAKVLFGELAPIGGGRAIAPLKFLRDVTCSKANYKAAKRCAPLKADGFAIHPYQFTSRAAHRRRPRRRRADRRALAPDERARQARQAQRAAHADQRQDGPLPDRVRLPDRGQPRAEAEGPCRLAAPRRSTLARRNPRVSSSSSTSSSTRPTKRSGTRRSCIATARRRRPTPASPRPPPPTANAGAPGWRGCSAPETTTGVRSRRRRHTKEEIS